MDIYTMEEYCEKIRQYLEIYDNNNQGLNSDFEAKIELKKLINTNQENEGIYFLEICEFVGKLTRIINNGTNQYDFINWIGKGEVETFTKNNFDQMMIKVCEI